MRMRYRLTLDAVVDGVGPWHHEADIIVDPADNDLGVSDALEGIPDADLPAGLKDVEDAAAIERFTFTLERLGPETRRVPRRKA